MEHHLLNYGVTGFWKQGESPPPTVSEELIMSDCHRVAAELGWTTENLNQAEIARNFHWIRLRGNTDGVSVLFNMHYPLIAFSDDIPVSPSRITFRDCPVLTEAFRRLTIFHPITKEQLNCPVEQFDFSRLNTAELEQFRYWRPVRLGDLIFNFWD